MTHKARWTEQRTRRGRRRTRQRHRDVGAELFSVLIFLGRVFSCEELCMGTGVCVCVWPQRRLLEEKGRKYLPSWGSNLL